MVIRFLLQLESPNLDHQNSSYCSLYLDYSNWQNRICTNLHLEIFLGSVELNFAALPSANLFPWKYSLPIILNHSIWMSETPLMSKTLQQYPKQSIISELHELTFLSVFGSLRATMCSWSLIYTCSPISYGSLPIGINWFG